MNKSKLYSVLRILLGLALLFFGGMSLFAGGELPEMNEAASAVVTAFASSGYILMTVSIVFLLTGLGFLLNKWVTLSALLLLPISVNIVLFHLFLEPAGSIPGIVILLLNLYMLCANKDKLKPILAMK